jgi:hypothetical protein
MRKISIVWLLFCSCIIASSADIDRKTFTLSLPDKWTENTKDDMYSPDSFIFFEGPESTFFCVVIGQKSAGASVDALVNKQRDVMVKKFTDVTVTEITKWSSFDGNGFKIDGKVQGIAKARVTMFGFEKGDNVCLVEEYATLGDYITYARDFQKLRQSFRLK